MNHTESMNDRQRELFTVACDALAAAVSIIRPPHSALDLDKQISPSRDIKCSIRTFGGGYAEIVTKLPSGDTLKLTLETYPAGSKLESK